MATQSRSSGRGGEPMQGELTLALRREAREYIASVSPIFKPRGNDHLGLWLDKLVMRRSGTWALEKDDRTRALKRFCGEWQSTFGKQALLRQRKSLEALHGKDLVWQEQADLDGRLLVDYGRPTATEVSISFHHVWGVPRIPATALKGITRAQMSIEDEVTKEQLAQIFGSEPESEELKPGCIAFYDALPLDGKFELDLDVLTPHHSSYYRGKGLPAEWEDPIPFTFLSVVKTRFVFALGFVPQPGVTADRKELVDLVGKSLRNALEEAGVGAKTAAGYGRFKDWKAQT
jgi:CRISPR-associated protein Cmr6